MKHLFERVDEEKVINEERLMKRREERAAWAEWYTKEVKMDGLFGSCGRDCWDMYRIAMLPKVKDREEAMMRLSKEKRMEYREIFRLRKVCEQMGMVQPLDNRRKGEDGEKT